jgi:hypothetical protein
MIVHNFHLKRPWGVLRPFKANPPLVIDADAVLALAITLKGFKPVSRGIKSPETVRRVEPFEPQHGLPLKPLKGLDPLAFEKNAGLFISKIYDHSVG